MFDVSCWNSSGYPKSHCRVELWPYRFNYLFKSKIVLPFGHIESFEFMAILLFSR